MTPRHRRGALLLAVALAAAGAASLVLNAFRSNLVFFYSPAELSARPPTAGRSLRLGGLVAPGSVRRDGLDVRFEVSDLQASLPVLYRGTLPDLFREGRGVVVQGRLQPDGSFLAHEVLAKHDENYAPPGPASADGEALRRFERRAADTLSEPSR